MTTNGNTKVPNATTRPPVDVAIATSPNNIEAVPALLKEITAGVNELSTGGDEARHQLLIKARTMVQSLETPRETMIKHTWAQTAAIAGLSFGVDTGLWKLMATNGDRPQKVSELAGSLGVDQLLLSRLMRHLGAMGYITEVDVDVYKPTNYAKAMSIPIIGDGYLAVLSYSSQAPIKFHEYSRKRGFVNPTNSKDTPLMDAYGMDMDMFAWLQKLGYSSHFNNHMGGYRQGRPPWMSFYPVKERLIAGASNSPDAAFLVDIGGNVGHDIMEFQRHYPNVPGKLILQDLPTVICQIQLDPTITTMSYDFHTEQPIKDARAYYMHSCLHDWPDEICKSILARISAAMKPGYSRLLINENVIPSKGAYWETTALDVSMMTVCCSMERTEANWYSLVEGVAGLKIVKIWAGGNGVESLIECELP